MVTQQEILLFGHKKELHSDTVYSGVQISWHMLFWAGNQGNHQNFDLSLLIFMGMKQIFFKIQNGRLKKTEIFNFLNSHSHITGKILLYNTTRRKISNILGN